MTRSFFTAPSETLASDAPLPQPASESLACDHYHPHYHYQASCYHLWHAEILRALGDKAAADAAYGKAFFHDHGNEEAAWRRAAEEEGGFYLPRYDAHPREDAPFRLATGQPLADASRAHDAALREEKGVAALTAIIARDPHYAPAHFTRAMRLALLGHYAPAAADARMAVTLAQIAHDAYHWAASEAHLARARAFIAADALDVALQDCTKALDLAAHNSEARALRALLYRRKGNMRAAEADEAQGRKG